MIPPRIICISKRITEGVLIKAPDNFSDYYIFQDCQEMLNYNLDFFSPWGKILLIEIWMILAIPSKMSAYGQ